MKDLGIIIQARIGASRLPSKVLLPFWENKGILEILIEKLNFIASDTPIIIATTTNPVDDKIEIKLRDNQRIKIFRGDEHNVLNRFISVAEKYKIKKIIRICADNPFLELKSLQKLIDDFRISQSDYLYYNVNGKPNMKTHYGFWAEGVTFNALTKIEKLSNDNKYLEHVTNFIYTFPERFQIEHYSFDFKKYQDKIRLTLDTIEDFEIQKGIYKDLISKFPEHNYQISDIIEYLDQHPEILKTMQRQIKTQEK